jgi:hypothetical protein
MRRLLIKWILLFLPVAAFLIWFEVARGGRESNLFRVKRNLLHAAAPRVEVLILGSSHEHEGIVPGLVHSNAFNLSAVSQSLYYDCALVQKYAPALPRLQLVVIPISYFSMELELEGTTEEWRSYYYRHIHGIPHRDFRQETRLRNWSAWFLFGRDFGLQAIRGIAPPLIRSDYDAAGGVIDTRPPEKRTLHFKPDYVQTSAPVAFARHTAFMHRENLPVHLQSLRELAAMLRQRGVRVVFMTLPVSANYLGRESTEARARTAEAIQALCREFGTEWKDYSGDPRFTDEDFWDADHLNFPGAAKFSRFLGEEFVGPQLARTPRP